MPARTVGAFLAEAGVALDPADMVQPAPDTALQPGVAVVVARAPLLSLSANGQTRLLRTVQAAPVAILAGLGLSLGPADELLADGVPLLAPAQALASLPRNLALLRAVEFTVTDGVQPSQSVRSPARTTRGAF